MIYKIKKGRHFSNFTFKRLWPFSSKFIYGTITFSPYCWYSRDKVQYTGWNKLIGISGALIHRNSGRLVWQPDFNHQGRIIIAAYVYKNGTRLTRPFASCMVSEPVFFHVLAERGTWNFGFGKQCIVMNGTIPLIGFRAFPYFGGRSKAPQDMNITIK